MNSFGKLFRLTTFGESHGPAIGGVLDGCPPALFIDPLFIQEQLEQRKSRNRIASTPRQEEDSVRWLSGISADGYTMGTPIAFIIENKATRSTDYTPLSEIWRPGHADFVYAHKYGTSCDLRGGGRASARETVVRVVAGAIAQLFLKQACGLEIVSYTAQVGPSPRTPYDVTVSQEKIAQAVMGGATPEMDALFQRLVTKARGEGDTLGAVVSTVVRHLPIGIGSPLYDKLSARLAYAMMSINATRGFEMGNGFEAVSMKGSQCNDRYTSTGEAKEGGQLLEMQSNHCGGVLAGISTGSPLLFSTAFKPISSINLPQETTTREGHRCTSLMIGGRHDAVVVPRVLPVVTAMTALVLADEYLLKYNSPQQP